MAPFGTLGAGAFKTKAQRAALNETARTKGREVTISDSTIAVAEVLEKVADRHNTLLTSGALAYVLHKTPYVFPIIGNRNIEHLKGNIEALNLKLSEDDIKEIEAAKDFDIGLPMSMFGSRPDGMWLSKSGGVLKYVEDEKPIGPDTKQS